MVIAISDNRLAIGLLALAAAAIALFIWSPWVSPEDRCAATMVTFLNRYAEHYVRRETAEVAETEADAAKLGIGLPPDCVQVAIECETPSLPYSPGVYYQGVQMACSVAIKSCARDNAGLARFCRP